MLQKWKARWTRTGARKTLTMMKWTAILLLATAMQVSAKGFSQSVTLSMKDAPLVSVFREIEKQTGYSFLYSQTDLDKSHKLDIEVKAMALEEALKICFRDQPLTWSIRDKFIVVREQEKTSPKTDKLNEPATPSGIDIKGRVINENNEPVAGASITLKGDNTKGTTTNSDGFFELQGVDAAATLVISGTTIETVEIKLNGRTYLEVKARIKIQEQEEVIVKAGYYDVKKKEATGSISRITAKTISQQPVTNPLAAAAGRMTGVNIQQTTGVPGGDFKIEIRGRNSLRLNGNDPLYIIDGVPFSSEKVSAQTTGGQLLLNSGLNPLTSINSADIESIEVLKDADATAIFGSRGANGVVLITTKKGKAGKTKVDVNYYSGFAKVRLQKLLNTQQYLAVRREAFANDNLVPTADPNDNQGLNGKGYAPDLMVWDTTRYTDWQKVFLGNTAKTTSIQTSVSGGNEFTQFMLSVGYYNETSVFPGENKFRKFSSHLSLNHTSANKKFFVNASVNGSRDIYDQPRGDFSLWAIRLAPDAPKLYNEDGTYNWEPHPVTGQSTWNNPMAKSEATYEGDVNNLITRMTIGYEIINGLKIQSSFGYNRLAAEELSFYPSTQFGPGNNVESSVNASDGRTNSWIIEPQLSWDKMIAKGKLSFLVGGTYQGQDHQLLAIQYTKFPSIELLRDLSAAASQFTNEYVSSIYKYAALFGRINYNWKGKYILNLTGRRDGSSRFGPGRQFANFGAVGASWIFSEELFSKKSFPFLSFGKLRGSFGITGNDQIGNYQFLDTYQTPQNINSYDGITVLDPTRLYNPVFGWESNKKAEVAVELGFLKERISLAIGYYHNRSSNQLVNYTLPSTTGFNGLQANLDATVQNTGVEAELTTVNFKSSAFSWVTSLNITIPRNKLISFPNLDSSSYFNTYIIGQSVYIQKFYEYTGVDPQTGLYTARDYNNDGIISRDADAKKAIFVGQHFYGGIDNSAKYKGWTLDIFLQVVKQTGMTQAYANGFQDVNFPVGLYNSRWTKPGDIATIQRSETEYTSGGISGQGGSLGNYVFSDAAVVDASFIRLKTVSLSYQFPRQWMKGFNYCMVFIRGQNLAVLTDYNGSDPETQSSFNLAPLRTITIGLNLTF